MKRKHSIKNTTLIIVLVLLLTAGNSIFVRADEFGLSTEAEADFEIIEDAQFPSEESAEEEFLVYGSEEEGMYLVEDVNAAAPDAINVINLDNQTSSSKANASVKNGWVWEDGLKFYYKNGVLQKDVRDKVSGPYHVCVNRQRGVVTVYAKSKNGKYVIPVVSFICSAGKNVRTPIGTFKLSGKSRWKHFETWDCWVQYAVRFETGRYFHSCLYTAKSAFALDPVTYEELGTKASHGCIRMLTKDVKWIYDHMEEIKEVRIYDSPVKGPFGRPKAPKVGKSDQGYYDPTDPKVK